MIAIDNKFINFIYSVAVKRNEFAATIPYICYLISLRETRFSLINMHFVLNPVYLLIDCSVMNFTACLSVVHVIRKHFKF